MDIIITNPERRDTGFLNSNQTIDLEVGEKNDFEITIPLVEVDPEIMEVGSYIFAIGTEYGGIIKNRKVNTKMGTIKYSGDTWRGMLNKRIIQPPDGFDHKRVIGELNRIINNLVRVPFEGLFIEPDTESGITLDSTTAYNFDRYCTLLDGVNKMLSLHSYRLNIKSVYQDNVVYIELSAVPVVDYSQVIETSQDMGIDFIVEEVGNCINHLICLGSGESTLRTVEHLYFDGISQISNIQTIFGKEERQAIYDYAGASDEDLINGGIKRLSELIKVAKQEVTIEDLEVELYDKVGGRERITGITIVEPVRVKILKIKNGVATIDYKIGN